MEIASFAAERSAIGNRNLVDIEKNNIGTSRDLDPNKL
jgi:hypothetical protein